LVARGFAVAAVARVMQISRQALYRTPTPRRPPQRQPVTDPVEQAIVEEAITNQTDGYRMVTAGGSASRSTASACCGCCGSGS